MLPKEKGRFIFVCFTPVSVPVLVQTFLQVCPNIRQTFQQYFGEQANVLHMQAALAAADEGIGPADAAVDDPRRRAYLSRFCFSPAAVRGRSGRPWFSTGSSRFPTSYSCGRCPPSAGSPSRGSGRSCPARRAPTPGCGCARAAECRRGPAAAGSWCFRHGRGWRTPAVCPPAAQHSLPAPGIPAPSGPPRRHSCRARRASGPSYR